MYQDRRLCKLRFITTSKAVVNLKLADGCSSDRTNPTLHLGGLKKKALVPFVVARGFASVTIVGEIWGGHNHDKKML